MSRWKKPIDAAKSAVLAPTVATTALVASVARRAWSSRAAGVLALEDHDAHALLDEFQRAVEKVGGMHWPGPDPLHLLEDAHGEVPGLVPTSSRAREEVVLLVLDLLGQLVGP